MKIDVTDNLNLKNKNNYLELLIILSFVFIVSFLPGITFSVIVYLNNNLSIYFNNYNHYIIKYGSFVTPSKISIIFNLWLGLFTFVVGFIMLMCTSVIVKKKSNTSKIIYILFITFFFIAASISFAVSAYNYSRFIYLFKFDKLNSTDSLFKQGDLSNEYVWTSESSTWWLLLVQFVIIIIVFSILENKAMSKMKYSDDINKIMERNIQKSFFGVSWKGLSRFFSKIFSNTEKAVSILMIIVSMVIITPQLIYVIKISLSSDSLNSMIKWTLISPDLTKSINEYSGLNNKLSQYDKSFFAIANLPIVFVALVLALMFIFISIYTRGLYAEGTVFISEYVVFFIMNLIAIAVSSYSMYETSSMTKFWNENNLINDFRNILLTNNESSSNTVANNLNSIINNKFIKNSENGVVRYEWVKGIEYISMIIISISFLVSVYIIIGYKIKLILKEKYEERINIIREKKGKLLKNKILKIKDKK